MNESGEALMTFCVLNELIILNTWFEKKTHKYTWQHPGSMKWHCIDYVLMKQSQRRLRSDVTVMRSADYWTDHKLLRAQLLLQARSGKRYAVAALRGENVRKEYIKCVRDAGDSKWSSEAVDRWSQEVESIKEWLTKAAESVLGLEDRRQPDWFQENSTVLTHMILKQNSLFSKRLRTHHHSDRQRYVAQRRAVVKEVRRVKNAWFQQGACEVEGM